MADQTTVDSLIRLMADQTTVGSLIGLIGGEWVRWGWAAVQGVTMPIYIATFREGV